MMSMFCHFFKNTVEYRVYIFLSSEGSMEMFITWPSSFLSLNCLCCSQLESSYFSLA